MPNDGCMTRNGTATVMIPKVSAGSSAGRCKPGREIIHRTTAQERADEE
jgi:hypothetical protein